MRKKLKYFILAFCLIVACIYSPNIVKADTFIDNTLIYTTYNDKAEYYENLTGITQISINKSYIAYTLDGNTIEILNKATKQAINLKDSYEIEHTSIQDIYLTKNFLIVQSLDDVGKNILSAYNLINFEKIGIYLNVQKTIELTGKKDFSISESNDKIILSCIDDNTFITHFFDIKDFTYINSYTNSALDNETATFLNVVTNDTNAYIISEFNEENNSNLYKIDYSKNSQINKSYFPKENIADICIYTCEDQQFLLAIDDSKSLYVIKSNLTFEAGKDTNDYADSSRTGNYTGTRFLANNFKYFNDIVVYNNDIYISDSGTKCIQKCKFQINSNKGEIAGTEVLIASECGEIGRFNKNSNLSLSGEKIVVADNKNKRVQIIDNSQVLSIDKDVLSNTLINVIDEQNLNNLVSAILIENNLYFSTYNNENGNQNLYKLNLETYELKYLVHSTAKIFDMTNNENYIFIVSQNGLHRLDLNDDSITNITTFAFAENSKISCNNEYIFVSSNNTISAYNLSGATISMSSFDFAISDIACNDTTLYVLDNLTKEILSYSLNNNLTYNNKITYPSTSDYFSLELDKLTGTIYVFDNNTCEIDKIINPIFNYVKNTGLFQVNNKNVSVYDRPYYLNGIDTPNVIKKLDVNTRITIYSKTFITYGNIDYYIIELNDGTFGYINKNDLTYTHNPINYEIILPNATLRNFDNSDNINVYDRADKNSEIIASVPVNTRVLIKEYKAENDFTFVRFYDENQDIIEGYVETNLINPDDMTNAQITALILIICSIILIIAIIIIARIIYKKRLKKLKEK